MTPAPTPAEERNRYLDTLRGVAVLGILLMNIIGFGMPWEGDANPHVYGGDTGPSLWYWFASQLFFEGKMRCIFSMLFGAGMLLLTARASRSGTDSAADIYLRRCLWLILFGMLHAYLLWYGDILYMYGLIGLALFPFRHVRPGRLLVIGFILISTLIPKAMLADYELKDQAGKAAAAQAAKEAGAELTEEQSAAIAAWEEKKKEFNPPREAIDKEIAAHRGGWVEAFVYRLKITEMVETTITYRWGVTDVGGMMFIGMALLKLGVFTGQRTTRFYLLMVLFGYGVGVSMNEVIAVEKMDADYDPTKLSPFGPAAYNYGRLLVALGHIAMVMLVCRSGRLGFLTRRLAAVGRMPLSNYFFETVACCLFFEGYGLGMYGKLERYELLYVVAGVWAASLLASPLWLTFFRYGPAEWVWRALTYWKCPALRVKAKDADVVSGEQVAP